MAKPKKILVVEDEKDIADIIKTDLQKAGYPDVDLVYDGEEGFEHAKTNNPDLIVLDVNLPKMDGYKLCELLKNNDKYKHIPIIMLTVRDSKVEAEFGYAVGANAYIIKPYKSQNLIAIVKSFLKD